MPREHKVANGDKLVEACLGVTCALVEVTYVVYQADRASECAIPVALNAA